MLGQAKYYWLIEKDDLFRPLYFSLSSSFNKEYWSLSIHDGKKFNSEEAARWVAEEFALDKDEIRICHHGFC